MSSVFLSHSHVDKPFARKLGADLRKSGHAVWIDEAEIDIGDSLIEKIREGIDQVDYVAAIISANSVESKWVTRELDIASNREIEEDRVIVLPILIEDVDMPGFLKGKLYGNFTDSKEYNKQLSLLLRKLGPAAPPIAPGSATKKTLIKRLYEARSVVERHQATLENIEKKALDGKSKRLVEAIESANSQYPEHAPINITTAFEVNSYPVTLDYLLWVIGKMYRQGVPQPLELLIDIENKWPEVNAMLEAYADLLGATDGEQSSRGRGFGTKSSDSSKRRQKPTIFF